jgi:hypothetical protein
MSAAMSEVRVLFQAMMLHNGWMGEWVGEWVSEWVGGLMSAAMSEVRVVSGHDVVQWMEGEWVGEWVGEWLGE